MAIALSEQRLVSVSARDMANVSGRSTSIEGRKPAAGFRRAASILWGARSTIFLYACVLLLGATIGATLGSVITYFAVRSTGSNTSSVCSALCADWPNWDSCAYACDAARNGTSRSSALASGSPSSTRCSMLA